MIFLGECSEGWSKNFMAILRSKENDVVICGGREWRSSVTWTKIVRIVRSRTNLNRRSWATGSCQGGALACARGLPARPWLSSMHAARTKDQQPCRRVSPLSRHSSLLRSVTLPHSQWILCDQIFAQFGALCRYTVPPCPGFPSPRRCDCS